MAWNEDRRTAPRDGRWLLLRSENGRVAMGRWEPAVFPLGHQQLSYEWRTFDAFYEDETDDEWNWWCDYTVEAWKLIPSPAQRIEARSDETPAEAVQPEGREPGPKDAPNPIGDAPKGVRT